MRVIRNRPGKVCPPGGERGCVVTVGNYDGVHRGHAALLDRCRQLAGDSAPVGVVTFEPLPQAFFNPDHAPARLSTVYQKLWLLRERGADITWLMRFGRRLAALTAQEFVEQVLVQGLAASTVVVGEDFRFGRGRQGDVALLAKLGERFGFRTETVPAVLHEGQRISSSGIRALLAAADFEAAEAWLGRPFRMEGHVVRGAALGRKLGYPTANLRIRARPSPLSGVLAAWARVAGGPWLPAVCNLGRRPAVGGGEPLLEVHFFDFDRDIYGQRLEVQFVAKLRDELSFDSVDDLVRRMRHDAAEARAYLAAAARPGAAALG